MIEVPRILNNSGFSIKPHSVCPNLKRNHWHAIDRTMTGDAPKDFIGVYEFGNGRKTNLQSWPRFIAKVGHKWYPNESVTEHLITRIGQSLNLNVADSRLVHLRGQLRFLSRYFLHETEYLLHGADIFASYLSDKEFVKGVEDEGKTAEIFDYDFAVEAIREMLPESADRILRDFRRMLAFDALIGNNDRHFFNWAVICDHSGKRSPRFSPIFDTARALFWNNSEHKLSRMGDKGGTSKAALKKYSKHSYSKIGTVNDGRVDHFTLLTSIIKNSPSAAHDLDILNGLEQEPADLVNELLKGEFSRLISPLRRHWICRLVEHRTEQFRLVLKGEWEDA